MAFTIPNQGSAAFTDQAQVDSEDFDILAAADAGTGVVDGCAVTGTNAANGSLSVAAGKVTIATTVASKIRRRLITTSAATLAIAANASGNPRYDLVSVGTSGTPTVTQGTAAASPVFPTLPADSAALAVFRVANGHTTGTTIATNSTSIVDKRVFLPESPHQTGGGLGSTGTEHQFSQTDWTKTLMRLQCRDFPGGDGQVFNNTPFQIVDYLDAPIMWVGGVGGLGINDDLYTAYSVLGPYPFLADIYGYQKQGKRWSYTFPGPPGNALTWNDAVHEIYGSTRAATTGSWALIANCTLSAQYLWAQIPGTESPTGYRGGLRITSSGAGGTAWIAQPGAGGGGDGVVAGDVVSIVAMIRSNSSAAARNWNVRVSWYTSGGVQVGADVNGSATSVPTQATTTFTAVKLENQIVPATATKFQLHILGAALVVGESFDVCGVALLNGQQSAVYGPPFVAYNASGQRTASGAQKGDRWNRTDRPDEPGSREYICTVGGVPAAQRWESLDSAGIKRLLNDAPVNTTVTLADLTQLGVSVSANATMMLDYTIRFSSAATTTGITFGFTGPAAPTSVLGVAEIMVTASTWETKHFSGSFTSFGASSGVGVANIDYIARIKLMVINGANAGTIMLRFASEVAASGVTVKRGSTVQVA